MIQRSINLRKLAQNIENFQIENLMNDSVSLSRYMRMQRLKERVSNRADFIEAQIPKPKKQLNLKAIVFALFPSAYYLIGR